MSELEQLREELAAAHKTIRGLAFVSRGMIRRFQDAWSEGWGQFEDDGDAFAEYVLKATLATTTDKDTLVSPGGEPVSAELAARMIAAEDGIRQLRDEVAEADKWLDEQIQIYAQAQPAPVAQSAKVLTHCGQPLSVVGNMELGYRVSCPVCKDTATGNTLDEAKENFQRTFEQFQEGDL